MAAGGLFDSARRARLASFRMMVQSDRAKLQVDLLVVGGGMTGLTAAAVAARRGLDVLLVEVAPELGGSAALSEGYVWTAPTLNDLRWEDPGCDSELGAALADHFHEGLGWVESLGVELSPEITGIYGFGRGHQIDIGRYLDRCRSALEAAGGWVSTGVRVRALTRRGAAVAGATAIDRGGDEIMIEAAWTLLATGGFQGDPELRRRFIGSESDRLLLRANPHSRGAGLRLGLDAGALAAGGPGFYGHLIATPLADFQPKDFLDFAQLHSGYCLLLNARGERFTDETMGDHVNNQATLRQPGSRAVLIGDDHVRRTHVMSAYIKGMDVLDKIELAGRAGAHQAVADSVGELARRVAAWGYDGSAIGRTVERYNELVDSAPEELSPASERYRRRLDTPPYFAVEVRPAITFPYAGLASDADARVHGANGPIAGLLTGGVDAGGVYERGYAGALARGLVFGMRAALTAASEPSWRPDAG
jgi:succinate dehydrogenase/fumarate reductase flavoprotein subunit